MIKYFFMVSLRNLRKHKGFSGINIAGLAIGMACCLLILIFITDELSYDRHHVRGDRIYRIVSHSTIGGTTRHFAASPAALAPAVKDTVPEVEAYARIMFAGRIQFQYEGRNLDIPDLYLADPDFFKIFSHEFLAGEPAEALRRPDGLVVTEETALKIFGKTDVLGKTITVNAAPRKFDFTVSGIIRNVPKNSHLRFNMLVPTALMRVPPPPPGSNQPPQTGPLDEWFAFGVHSYLLLANSTDAGKAGRGMAEVVEKRWGEWLRQKGVGRRYELQNLRDIHLRSSYEAELQNRGSIQYVYLFGAIALFVLFIACFNFVNLSTARSTLRAKEVGLKRVFGASRRQLIRQFLGESVFIAVIAMAIAVLLVLLILPAFNGIAGKQLGSADVFTPAAVLGLAAIIVLAGVGAGIFPAFVLSAFDPVRTVRGRLGSGAQGQTLRKLLVVIQFAIAVFMIVGIAVVVRQIHFLKNKDLGFNKEMMAVIPVGGPRNDALRDRILGLPGVRAVSFDGTIPGQQTPDDTFIPQGRNQEETIRTTTLTVGYDFLPTYEIDLVWGRNFSREHPTDAAEGLIINETTARELGWGEDAVGKEMVEFDAARNVRYKVIGVVRDFHHKSLKMAINPTALKLNTMGHRFVSVRLRQADLSATLESLGRVFKEFVPQAEYRYFFLDEDFRQKYPNEERARAIYTYFGVLAVVVACLGLFGLASFIIQRRTKEIGIRKSLGAGVRRIIFSLSREFLGCVLLANAVAWPAAYFFMMRWLRSFAYQTGFEWWILVLAAGLSLAIAALTVSFQSVRSARANPADSLRYE